MRYFDPMVGYEGDTVCLDMDLENAVLDGIVIPAKGESFRFAFDTIAGQRLYYKIFYQNESYKFDETDSLSHENFYGSWEDVSVGFKQVPDDGHILDSFRIVGNPRDERKYYGVDLEHYNCSAEALQAIEREIRADTQWFRYVSQVAAPQNNRTLEEQLFLDTRWVLNERRHLSGDVNHRWKRNPRAGCYSFLLVICDEDGLKQIPDYIQHINLTDADSHFVNPYGWLAAHCNKHISMLYGSKVLRTRAVLTPSQGLFVDDLQLRTAYRGIKEKPGQMGTDTALYRHALYQQFFPAVSQQYTLRNIPLVQDIDGYSQADYAAATTRYDSSQLVYDYPQISDYPGSTVFPSPSGEYISIVNPGNAGLQHPKKESTGVKTRVGFTYGRYRGKIKFPSMLNSENVWNGLTYAFWLIYQDDGQWNLRRPSPNGYLDKNEESDPPNWRSQDKYSEIDIEIVKASPYWPDGYYHGKKREMLKRSGVSLARQSNDVMFCCTNWDLACHDPQKFAPGITEITYLNQSYEAMRWYDTYKALTTKTPIPDSIFDADVYYYEIEWRPKEIIWRLGPDPQHMRVVGYMNDKYTAIPGNQMLCIVTQEYHYSEWWPPEVYMQGLIPFNATDIVGRVYEIVVE
ncbi:MAG: hypothetical protein IKP21_06390 [Bacteroidales bacterium]|nr:hypothetical protein [Bacteroidales bacterium]